MEKFKLEFLNDKFKDAPPQDSIGYVLEKVGKEKVVLASSLSIEDQILTDMIIKVTSEARIFFIDTGRHFQETYDLIGQSMKKYHFKYEVYSPESRDVEELVSQYGPNLFYESIDLRKKCCEYRKVKPLNRALSNAEAWICGLRRDQSVTRQKTEIFEWDHNHKLLKVNPLVHWSEDQVWEYLKKESVPFSKLYERGFQSVGCQPCTRGVAPGEELRSGRWWWESPDKKECGLHVPGYSDLDIYR